MPIFYKYQGAGNDFIVLDNMEGKLPLPEKSTVSKLCNRKFGIGADGLIVLAPAKGVDFEMIYYNPDGSQSLCGNGCRCAVAFARKLGLIEDKTKFLAIDGEHLAEINENTVRLLMNDVKTVETIDNDLLIDTGSPHYLKFVTDLDHIDLIDEAKKIRYNSRFKANGVNVNFVENTANGIKIRTYERGVEDETLSCGTGVTAAALGAFVKGRKETK